MTETRISVSLIIAILLLAGGVILALQPYSVRSQWAGYDGPGHRFLSAALEHDSAELGRIAVSPVAVDWALQTEREHRHDLSVWARFGRPWTGVTRSDTTTVVFETGTDVCPLMITFVGPESRARVLEANTRCYSDRRRAH
jgi:hypothetical protein